MPQPLDQNYYGGTTRPDPQDIAQQQQQAQEAQRANNAALKSQYEAEGRPHYSDPYGNIQPKHDDETWRTMQQQKLDEQNVKQAQAGHRQNIASAKKAGMEVKADETGTENIATNEDGTPRFIPKLDTPRTDDKGNTTVPYRDAQGNEHAVSADAITWDDATKTHQFLHPQSGQRIAVPGKAPMFKTDERGNMTGIVKGADGNEFVQTLGTDERTARGAMFDQEIAATKQQHDLAKQQHDLLKLQEDHDYIAPFKDAARQLRAFNGTRTFDAPEDDAGDEPVATGKELYRRDGGKIYATQKGSFPVTDPAEQAKAEQWLQQRDDLQMKVNDARKLAQGAQQAQYERQVQLHAMAYRREALQAAKTAHLAEYDRATALGRELPPPDLAHITDAFTRSAARSDLAANDPEAAQVVEQADAQLNQSVTGALHARAQDPVQRALALRTSDQTVINHIRANANERGEIHQDVFAAGALSTLGATGRTEKDGGTGAPLLALGQHFVTRAGRSFSGIEGAPLDLKTPEGLHAALTQSFPVTDAKKVLVKAAPDGSAVSFTEGGADVGTFLPQAGVFQLAPGRSAPPTLADAAIPVYVGDSQNALAPDEKKKMLETVAHITHTYAKEDTPVTPGYEAYADSFKGALTRLKDAGLDPESIANMVQDGRLSVQEGRAFKERIYGFNEASAGQQFYNLAKNAPKDKLPEIAAKLGLTEADAKHWQEFWKADDFEQGDKKEKVRVRPDGSISLNPEIWIDREAMKAAIGAAKTTPEQKQAALTSVDNLYEAASSELLKTLPFIEQVAAKHGATALIPGAINFHEETLSPDELAKAKADALAGSEFTKASELVKAWQDEQKAPGNVVRNFFLKNTLAALRGSLGLGHDLLGIYGAVTGGSRALGGRAALEFAQEIGQANAGLGQMTDKLPGKLGAVTSFVVEQIPALALAGAIGPEAFTAQAFGGTFANAYEANKRQLMQQGMSEDDAHSAAVLKSYAAALASAAATHLIFGGKVNASLRSIAGAPNPQQLVAKMIEGGAARTLTEMGRHAAIETVKLSAMNLADNIIGMASYNPDMTLGEAFAESIKHGAAAGAMFGAFHGFKETKAAKKEGARWSAYAAQRNEANKDLSGWKPIAATDVPLYDALMNRAEVGDSLGEQSRIHDLAQAIAGTMPEGTSDPRREAQLSDLAQQFTQHRDAVNQHAVDASQAVAALREAPAEKRDFYSAALKAHMGATDFTPGELKAIRKNPASFTEAEKGAVHLTDATRAEIFNEAPDIGRIIATEGSNKIAAANQAVTQGAQQAQPAPAPGRYDALPDDRPATAQETEQHISRGVNELRKRSAKIAGKVQVVEKTQRETGAAYDPQSDQIHVAAAELRKDAAGMTPRQFAEHVDRSLREEEVHMANHHVAEARFEREAGQKARHEKGGTTEDFHAWREKTYGEMWRNDFTDEQRQHIAAAYGNTKGEMPRGMADWQKAMEGLRMLVQERGGEGQTERARVWTWKDLPQAILDHLKAALDYLRGLATKGKLPDTLERELQAIEKVLQSFRDEKAQGSEQLKSAITGEGADIPPGKDITLRTPDESRTITARATVLDVSQLITSADPRFPGKEMQLRPTEDSPQRARQRQEMLATLQDEGREQWRAYHEGSRTDTGRIVVAPLFEDGTHAHDEQGRPLFWVVSGNGRAGALGELYTGHDATHYDKGIREALRGEGVDAAGIEKPVSVAIYEPKDVQDAKDIARLSNPDTGTMEKAIGDADALHTKGIIGLWETDAEGNPAAASNRPFWKAVEQHLPGAEKDMHNGRPSDELVARVENAMLAHMLGGASADRALLTKVLFEDRRLGMRNLVSGIVSRAPDLARLAHDKPALDITPLIHDTLAAVASAKEDMARGTIRSVGEYFDQRDAFITHSPTVERFARAIAEGGSRETRQILDEYVRLAKNAETETPMLGGFDAGAPSRENLLQQAVEARPLDVSHFEKAHGQDAHTSQVLRAIEPMFEHLDAQSRETMRRAVDMEDRRTRTGVDSVHDFQRDIVKQGGVVEDGEARAAAVQRWLESVTPGEAAEKFKAVIAASHGGRDIGRLLERELSKMTQIAQLAKVNVRPEDIPEGAKGDLRDAIKGLLESGLKYKHGIDGDWRSKWSIASEGRRVRFADGSEGVVTKVDAENHGALTIKRDDGRTVEGVDGKTVWAKLTPHELALEPHVVRQLPVFHRLKNFYDMRLEAVANSIPGATRVRAPLKGIPRALEKLAAKRADALRFAGLAKDPAKRAAYMRSAEPSRLAESLHDILRGSIIVDDASQIARARAMILHHFAPDSAQQLSHASTDRSGVETWQTDDGRASIKIDDRFRKPTASGYSDVQMKVEVMPGRFTEIQVHIPEMLVAKEGNGVKEMPDVPQKYWPENLHVEGLDPEKPGHVYYELWRALSDAEKGGPKGQALNVVQERLYRAALAAHEARITSSSNSSTNEANASRDISRVSAASGHGALEEGSGTRPSGETANTLPSSTATGVPSSLKNLAPGEKPIASRSTGVASAISKDNVGSGPEITSKNVRDFTPDVDVSALHKKGTDPALYFEMPEGAQLVPVEKLYSTKDQREDVKYKAGTKRFPVQNAVDFMAAGAKKRAPLSVERDGDRFHILDGNATAQAMMLAGFEKAPVIIQDAEQLGKARTSPDPHDREAFRDWLDAQPFNKPLIFRSPDREHERTLVVSPNARSGERPWRVTYFDSFSRQPLSHEEFDSREEAARHAASWYGSMAEFAPHALFKADTAPQMDLFAEDAVQPSPLFGGRTQKRAAIRKRSAEAQATGTPGGAVAAKKMRDALTADQGDLFGSTSPGENDNLSSYDTSAAKRPQSAGNAQGRRSGGMGGADGQGGFLEDLFSQELPGTRSGELQPGDGGSGGRGDGGRRGGGSGDGVSGGPQPGEAGEAESNTASDGQGQSGGVGSGDAARTPRELERPAPDAPERNFSIAPGDELAPRGNRGKAKANFTALKLLKQLEDEGRDATPEEKKTLASYTGWGAIKGAFDERKGEDVEYYRSRGDEYADKYMPDELKSWEKNYFSTYKELKENMTDDEFRRASRSTLNAHYTTPEIIDGIWQAARKLGFKGGDALEPGAGIGHFIGTQPEDLASRTRWQAVELDHLTARILAKLYPEARVNEAEPGGARDVSGLGFEKARIPDNSLDLVISNVPFHEDGPPDARYPLKLNLHNYFFARALDKAKPGGLVAFITSSSTMENNRRQREFIAQRGDLVGAVRLPNNAFSANAGTAVTTDILFFRKPDGKPFVGKNWLQKRQVGEENIAFRQERGQTAAEFREEMKRKGEIVSEKRIDAHTLEAVVKMPIEVNEYFADHPQNVLGTHGLGGKLYGGRDQYTVNPLEGEKLAEQMTRFVNRLPENVLSEPSGEFAPPPILAERGDRPFNHVVRDGKIYEVQADGTLKTPDWASKPAQVEKFRTWARVRDLARELVQREADPSATDEQLDALRRKLNGAYDSHRERNGPISQRLRNPLKFLQGDPDFPLTAALEVESKSIDATTGKAIYSYKKAALFEKRLGKPAIEPVKAGDIGEAINNSLAWRARLDPEYIAKQLGRTPEEAKAELLENPNVFEDHDSGQLVTADEYLSGNVREKLAQAEAALQDNPSLARNVEALRKAQPERKTIDRITPVLGSRWIPAEVYNGFIRDVLKGDLKVTYHPEANAWTSNRGRCKEGGTERVNAADLLKDILDLRETLVYNGRGEDRTFDPVATAAARGARERMKDAFVKYAKTHDGEIEHETEDGKKISSPVWKVIEDEFNRTQNGYVAPSFSGEHLQFPGLSEDVWRTPHRRAVVARFLQTGFGMMAHGVGSGKTFNQIILAQELRRTGKANRPLIVVQNSTIGQFAASYRQAYPNANILVADERTLGGDARRTFTSRVATGNYDAIIMTHSQFERIPNRPEAVEEYLNEQIQTLKDLIKEEQRQSGKGGVRDLEGILKTLEEKRDGLLSSLRKRQDNTLFWEDMGVDALILDEAHAFKSVPIITRMTRVKGVPANVDSQKGIGLAIKARGIQARTKGKNVFLATGTPVKNTMAEAYIWMEICAPHVLRDYHIHNFDDFAMAYGKTFTEAELNWGSEPKMETRFSKFINGSSLVTMIRSAFDVAMGNEKLGLDVPKMKGGGPQLRIVDPTPANKRYNQWVRMIAEAWKVADSDTKQSYTGVPISTMQAGIAAALDPRMIDPRAPDDPRSKVNQAVREAVRIYKEGGDKRSTQLMFADLKKPYDYSYIASFMRAVIASKSTPENLRKALRHTPFTDADLNATGEARGDFHLYEDIKKKLVAGGVPENEILVIDGQDKKELEPLWEKVNNGQFRIVIGSTERLGVGVNVQERLKAVHHLMPPRDMTPAMYEQRNGRIIRQGNFFAAKVGGKPAWNEEVEVNNWGVGGSMDSAIYGTLARKQRFIAQILSNEDVAEEFDDPTDPIAANMAEMAARTMGDADFIRRVEIEKELGELRLQQSAHVNELAGKRRALKWSKDLVGEHLPRVLKEIAGGKKEFGEAFTRKAPAPQEYNERIAKAEADGDTQKAESLRAKLAELPVYEFGGRTIDTAAKENSKIIEPLDLWLLAESKALERRGQSTVTHELKINGSPFKVEIHTTMREGDGTPGYVKFGTGMEPYAGAQSLLRRIREHVGSFERREADAKAQMKDTERLIASQEKAIAEHGEFPHDARILELAKEREEVEQRIAEKAKRKTDMFADDDAPVTPPESSAAPAGPPRLAPFQDQLAKAPFAAKSWNVMSPEEKRDVLTQHFGPAFRALTRGEQGRATFLYDKVRPLQQAEALQSLAGRTMTPERAEFEKIMARGEERAREQGEGDDYLFNAPVKPSPRRDAVEEVLRQVPEKLRNIFADAEAGRPVADIAAQHGLSEVAVRNITNNLRARVTLAMRAAGGMEAKRGFEAPEGAKDFAQISRKLDGGRPDLALGAEPDVAAIDQMRNAEGAPGEVSREQMNEHAARILSTGEGRELVKMWARYGGQIPANAQMSSRVRQIITEAQAGGYHHAMLTAAAKRLVLDAARDGALRDPAKAVDAAEMVMTYRELGSEQARALAMRYDPYTTPAERHAAMLTESLLAPDPKMRAAYREAVSATDRRAILKQWTEKMRALKQALKADGIDIDAMLDAWHEEQKARTPLAGPAKEVIEKADAATKTFVEALQQGATGAQAARAAGLTKEQALAKYRAFMDRVEAAGVEAAKRYRQGALAAAGAGFGEHHFAEAAGLHAVRDVFENWDGRPKPTKTSARTPAARRDTTPYDRAGNPVKGGGVESYERGSNPLHDPLAMRRTLDIIATHRAGALDKILEYWKASILSGPKTHIVNTASNLAFQVYDQWIKRLPQAALNDFLKLFGMGSAEAPSTSDFFHMARAAGPALRSSWRNALRALKGEHVNFAATARGAQEQLSFGGGKLETHAPAIGGLFGRIVRLPFNALQFADELFKGMAGHMEAAAAAHRIAKAEKLNGASYEARVASLMNTPGSLAWQRAADYAEKVTFQDELGKGRRTIDYLDKIAKGLAEMKNRGGVRALDFIIPFIKTPTNILKRGIEYSPLGGVLALADMVREHRNNAANRRNYGEETARRMKGEIYNAARAIEDVTQQVIAWGLLFAMKDFITPDDDGMPVITGSSHWRASQSGQRDLDQRAAPPQSIRIGGQWYSYARLEPFASALTQLVDGMKALHEGRASGYFSTVVGQLKDKTFLNGVSDVVNAIEDPERYGNQWAAHVITGFVPNFIQQPVKAADDEARDTRRRPDEGFFEELARRIGQTIMPQHAPPKVDVWGEPVSKDNSRDSAPLGDFVMRLLSPVERRAANANDIDLYLLAYNQRHPDNTFAPQTPDRRLRRTINGKQVSIALNDEEYTDMLTQAGKLARSMLGDEWNWREPTEQGVNRIRETLRRAHDTIRKNFITRHADELMARYNQITNNPTN